MNGFPKVDMSKAARLTQAGRLKEAMDVLMNRQPPEAPENQAAPTAALPRAPKATTDLEQDDAGNWTATHQHRGARDMSSRSAQKSSILGTILDTLGVSRPEAFVERARRQAPGRAEPASSDASFRSCSFSNEFGTRPYRLYVPTGYTGSAMPLVIMLHGCTQSPEDFAAGTRMNEWAEAHGFLVAYPGQTRNANASKCWNWFNENDQHRDRGEPALIAGITRQIMADWAVDPRCVFVAGLSAGGAQAAIMGATYPELFAAIGVHSGLACGAARDMMSGMTAMRNGSIVSTTNSPRTPTVPTIVFHGDRDSTVAPINGDQIIAQAAMGLSLTMEVTEGRSPAGMRYTRRVQRDRHGEVQLEQWVLHGASHAWSGGSGAGSYTDAKGPDASEAIVRFFLKDR